MRAINQLWSVCRGGGKTVSESKYIQEEKKGKQQNGRMVKRRNQETNFEIFEKVNYILD